MRGNDRAAANCRRSASQAASCCWGCEIVTVGAKDYERASLSRGGSRFSWENLPGSALACLLPLHQVEGAMCCKHLLPIALLLTPLVAGASPQQWHGKPTTGATTEATAIVEFARATNAYANLHRIVAASLLPEETCADPEETQRRVGQLAEALRSERSAARAGDVFTPVIASIFRRRLADALRRSALRGEVFEPQQAPEDEPRMEVNDAFAWIAGHGMQPAILATLTPLPPELEYRFVYRDLVLLDVGANLIVDILEDALPVTPSGYEAVQPWPASSGGCAVHPDLPMCWS